jgi:hypothetical protein
LIFSLHPGGRPPAPSVQELLIGFECNPFALSPIQGRFFRSYAIFHHRISPILRLWIISTYQFSRGGLCTPRHVVPVTTIDGREMPEAVPQEYPTGVGGRWGLYPLPPGWHDSVFRSTTRFGSDNGLTVSQVFVATPDTERREREKAEKLPEIPKNSKQWLGWIELNQL